MENVRCLHRGCNMHSPFFIFSTCLTRLATETNGRAKNNQKSYSRLLLAFLPSWPPCLPTPSAVLSCSHRRNQLIASLARSPWGSPENSFFSKSAAQVADRGQIELPRAASCAYSRASVDAVEPRTCPDNLVVGS